VRNAVGDERDTGAADDQVRAAAVGQGERGERPRRTPSASESAADQAAAMSFNRGVVQEAANGHTAVAPGGAAIDEADREDKKDDESKPNRKPAGRAVPSAPHLAPVTGRYPRSAETPSRYLLVRNGRPRAECRIMFQPRRG